MAQSGSVEVVGTRLANKRGMSGAGGIALHYTSSEPILCNVSSSNNSAAHGAADLSLEGSSARTSGVVVHAGTFTYSRESATADDGAERTAIILVGHGQGRFQIEDLKVSCGPAIDVCLYLQAAAMASRVFLVVEPPYRECDARSSYSRFTVGFDVVSDYAHLQLQHAYTKLSGRTSEKNAYTPAVAPQT